MIEMPKIIQPEGTFDPESIQVLASAFDKAWDRLQKSGSQLARPAYFRAVREVIAKRIIEIARLGVEDPQTLADDAMQFLIANYSGESNSKARYRS